MSYFSQWQSILNNAGNSEAVIKQYYQLETEAYAAILNQHDEKICGTAADIAQKLGFGSDMVIFVGFLDGLNPSLSAGVDLENIEDATDLALEIDFPKLYWNMHEAKADWLYGLKEWDLVLPAEEQQRLTKEYRTSKIVRHEKIGRNDPCPCGSGKKYKNCCGKGAF